MVKSLNAFNSKESVVLSLLDFTTAFNRAPFNILMNQFRYNGISEQSSRLYLDIYQTES